MIFDKSVFHLLRFRFFNRFVDERESKLQCIYMYNYIYRYYIKTIFDPSDQDLFHVLACPPWAVLVELEL